MWPIFLLLFQVICVVFTLGMVLRWYFKYTLDEDLSTITFTNYYDTKADVYPVLSLCFRNPFKKDKLSNYAVNESVFTKLLEGEHYEERLLDLNYNDISFELEDYIEEYWARYQNGTTASYSISSTEERLFNVSFIGFWRKWFYHCYGIQIPIHKLHRESAVHIEVFGLLLKNEIFPSGNRPTDKDFITFLHYPKQLLLSLPTVKYSWQKRLTQSTYVMRYIINGMEILNRRQKNNFSCEENWQSFDDLTLDRHLKRSGCRATYHKERKDIPLCKNRTRIKRANFPFRSDEIEKYDPPCKAVEKIHYTYEESDWPDTDYSGTGRFWVCILLLDSRYKEITQNR